MAASSPALGISWSLASISGYGIYGVQILLQYLRRGGDPRAFVLTTNPSVTVLPPLTMTPLNPIFDRAVKVTQWLKEHPGEVLAFKHAMLHGCGNDFSGFEGQDRVWGEPNVACAAIESLVCSENGRAIAKTYDMFIAISSWNAEYLKSLDVGPVHLRYQGIDPSLFAPGESSGLYRDRFVIFSGGKFEYRKGQDIVTAAFRKFYMTHPDALLVTCWQNLSKPDGEAFARAGLCDGVPDMAEVGHGLRVTPWLLRQGLPPESFIDLPYTHNLLMPSVLHECDVAIFPNRCEGGTNLVAMEAMACGVPTFVSYNTGQKDLVDLIGCGALRHQRPVIASAAMQSVEDWGESSVEEVVAALEAVYNDRAAARRAALETAEKVRRDWAWGPLNEKLIQTVCEGKADA